MERKHILAPPQSEQIGRQAASDQKNPLAANQTETRINNTWGAVPFRKVESGKRRDRISIAAKLDARARESHRTSLGPHGNNSRPVRTAPESFDTS